MQFGTFFNQIDSAVCENEIKSIEQGLEALALKGLAFVDVYADLLKEKYGAGELYLKLNNFDINVASVFHITEFEYQRDDILEYLKEDAKIQLEKCAQLDCKMFMPVPTVSQNHESEEERKKCRDKIAWHINDIKELAKEYEIKTVIENFSDLKTPFATIEDVKFILDCLPDVGYVLDTGNFWFGGADILKATKQFVQKTVHMHLKDIMPKDNGALNICGKSADSVAIGQGVIPFAEIFQQLKCSGYDKTATIEINDKFDVMNKISASLDFLNAL